MDKVIGIDLGTTFSAAAYLDEQGRLEDLTNGKSISSVVYVKGDEIIVGLAAFNRRLVDEQNVIRWVKRAMGDPDWQHPRHLLFIDSLRMSVDPTSNDVPDEIRQQLTHMLNQHGKSLSPDAVFTARTDRWIVRENGTAYVVIPKEQTVDVYEGFSAVQVSAEILKAVKKAAESKLGFVVDRAVITCPAYFNDVERHNTQQAGELAGFKVDRIVEEPVAAAVCHGVGHLKPGQKLMVCDLGGGTFDATILGLQGTKFDPLATVGDRELGGHDWTSDLKDLAAERIILDAHEDPRNDVGPRETLYDACEQAKRGFKMVDPQMVACSMGNQMRQVSITQKDFEERTEHLIRRMLDTCENCLKKAGMGWKDLQTILMVGGSSRMRRVAEALREASGRQPELARTPDTMVVFGAAHIARGIVGATSRLAATPPGGRQSSTTSGISAEPEVRSNRALGTQAYDRDSKQVVNVLVLPHGLKAPVERSCDDFEISVDNQENFDIPVAEYEDRTFDENQYTEPGTNFRFWCRKGSRHGERIRVTLGYDKSLIIQAEAVDLTTNQALRVDRVPYRKPTAGALRIVPKWVVFALDVSGSMSEHNKISIAKDALVTNARDLLAAGGGDCKVGIVTFSAESTAICQPTSDIDEIERCVSPVSTDSTTAMDKGIREAVHMVMTAPAGVDRTVVMVTDGMPDSRDDTLAAKVFAEGRGVRLSTLGVGHDEVDEQFLGQLGPFLAVDFDKIADGIATLLSISKFGQTQGSQGSASGTRGGIWYDPTGMKGGKKP